MKSPEAIAAIVADYRAGVPVNAIVRKHGTSAESVRTYARNAGIGPRPPRTKAACVACTAMRVLDADGLCETCAEDVPLTDGRWVRNGLTLTWVANPRPNRRELSPALSLIACPKCQATVTESCRTKRGHRTSDHIERLTPRLCRCGKPPKPSSRYCARCAREAALEVKRESYRRAKGEAA